MAKIIFVGVHNKPGMQPLDSKTKSGKLIDRIIEKLDIVCYKTNLFDCDYLPEKSQLPILSFDWIERVKIVDGDIIVLLGATVHKYFPPLPPEFNPIKVHHPASKRSHAAMEEYVNEVFELINNLTNTFNQ